MSLAGKRIFITGGSRGIGLAIALRAARDGASIAIAAKQAFQTLRMGHVIVATNFPIQSSLSYE